MSEEEEKEVKPAPAEEDAERRIRRLSRRSFLWAGAATAGTLGGLYAFNRYAPDDRGDGVKNVLRGGYRFNESVARAVFFSDRHRAPEYPFEAAVEPPNNYHGATPVIELGDWRLRLEGVGNGDARTLALPDLTALPKVAQTTELKCVEGWSRIVNWGGVRFRDFAEKYPPPPGTRFVAMRSEPAGWESEWYYVGLDLESCLHPQTILAYEMNGKPLTAAHGAPLRLAIPHKYGIKNIKLITHITYSDRRPADFWAERGYDWYAGL